MSEQPEALRLAENLDATTKAVEMLSTELSRLYEVNAELLEALKWYVENDDTNEGDEPFDDDGLRMSKGETWNTINAFWIEGLNKARAAIAKAKG